MKIKTFILLSITNIILFSSCSVGKLVKIQKHQASGYLIKNVSVFTGMHNTPVLYGVNVLIQGDTISKISTDNIDSTEKTVINGEGKMLLPGFTDFHTHITSGAAIPWKMAMLPTMNFNFEACLYSGVTNVVDMGGKPEKYMQKVSKKLKTGKTIGPRLYYCGIGFTATGSHPFPFVTKIKESIPFFLSPFVPQIGIAIDKQEDFTKIEEHLAASPDFTKVYMDEMPLNTPKMGFPIFQQIVKYSHKKNIPVLVHIGNNDDLKMVINAYADGAAHIVYREKIDTSLVKQMAEKNIFIIPTIVVWDNYAKLMYKRNTNHYTKLEYETMPFNRKKELKKGFPSDFIVEGEWKEWDKKLNDEYIANLYPNLLTLKKYGVTILAGTDSPSIGIFPGGSVHTELVHMVNAGLTPTEALYTATSEPAKVLEEKFHKEVNFGTIQEGKSADFIIVSGNPTINISDTQNIIEVFYKGKRIERIMPKK